MVTCGSCGCEYNEKDNIHFCTGPFGVGIPASFTIGTPDGGGLRYDDNKQRFDLIPVQLLEHLASVYTYGAGKYADWNWKRGMKWSRVIGSLWRHFVKFMRGERLDKESGLPHLAHMFWNVGTLLFYSETPGYEEYDDRQERQDGLS